MKRLMKSVCVLPLIMAGFESAPVSLPADPPNVIYVMLDDAGWGDFGANGSQAVKTPVFDRMCAEGMRFTDHYSGSAVCAPTRCVLITGLHPGHCRRRDNTATGGLEDFADRPLVFLEKEDVTVAEVMKEAGYVTGGIGKWGLGNTGTDGAPDKQGFDHFYGYLDQVHAHSYYPDWLWHDGDRQELPGNKGGAKATYTHDLFEADSLRFIRKNRNKRFFLYLPYTLPHGKYEIPSDAPYTDESWPQMVKNYAAMITRADTTVGKILELLAELELDEKTIVFYTSDNGPNRPFVKPLGSAGPFRGTKRQLYEGGLRAPMAVRWPGKVPAGRVSDYTWSMVDVFPTVCDLAGAEAPEHLDGHSVLPTLLGKDQPPPPFLYWEIHHPFQQAVRMGKWKGIRFGTEEPLALYDVIEDPGEREDRVADHAAIADEIAAVMEAQHVPSRYYPALARKKQQKKKRKGAQAGSAGKKKDK